MSKSIAEMRASGQVRRRTEKHTICLDVDLAEAYRAARAELVEAIEELEKAGQKAPGPQRLGAKGADLSAEKAKIEEKSAAMDELAEQMAEFEVEITLERDEPAKWNEWCAEHPARENEPDEQGRRLLVIRDAQRGGRVNFDALIADLFRWVTELNGEPVTSDDWAWLAGLAAPADLDDVGDLVLTMHCGRVNLPKSLKSSLGTLIAAFDSNKPEPTESADDASKAGSPSTKPSTSTTKTDD